MGALNCWGPGAVAPQALAQGRACSPNLSAAGDRLSQLQDRVLGHILSFLPAKEAACTALLSWRWRNVFAGVHTVSLEQPESPVREPDDHSPGWSPPPDSNEPPPFPSTISAALLARNRRRGAVPLRAFRVANVKYSKTDTSTMDQWVSFALQQAAVEGLDLDLRLRSRCSSICPHPYSLRGAGQGNHDQSPAPASRGIDDLGHGMESSTMTASANAEFDADSDDDLSVRSNEDDHKKERVGWWSSQLWEEFLAYVYTIPRVIYSCAQLRLLSLGSCKLAPPANVSMPSLETLLLSHISDPGNDVERLISGCPCLVDLTLEACDTVTTLSVLSGARLRRLALRCCHNLVTVAIDSSELQAFEYRGSVPENNFLSLHGGTRGIAYCKVDICGEEVSSEDELVMLRQLLQLFANAQYLHLESARLGSGLDNDVLLKFPSFPSLRHLELRGRLPDDDTSVLSAVRRILEHSPNLEELSLVFHPEKHHRWSNERDYYFVTEGDLLDAHHLKYNPYSSLVVPCALIPCLRTTVREINLVHYQGGTAQRTLAKFLLSNAPVMDELRCELAEGPLWTQTQLMREIKGWVINKAAATHIS